MLWPSLWIPFPSDLTVLTLPRRYLAPYACHRPHLPAARHIGALKGLKVPRVPSWNESDANIAKKVRGLVWPVGHAVHAGATLPARAAQRQDRHAGSGNACLA